jgi:ribosomal protein L24E
MSRDDVCFVDIKNYILGCSFSQSTLQKGSVCMYIHNDVSLILIFLNIAKKKFWKYVQYKLKLQINE